MKKNILLAITGNIIEWYDFILFSSFATVISELFFPEDNLEIRMLKIYGIFAAGFIARPIGGLTLGYIGDKYGRKIAFIASIFIMALSTIFIAFLPTYNKAGFFSTFCLVILRIVQGFALGGEYSGSMVLLSEYAPIQKRAFYSSWVDVGCLLGVSLGSVSVFSLNYFLNDQEIISGWWRIPFLIGGLFSIVFMVLRKRINETEIFINSKLLTKKASDIIAIFENTKNIIKVVLVYAFGNVCFYIFFVFLPNYYITHLNLAVSYSFLLTIFLSLTMALFIPIGGYLSDKYGRKLILLAGIVCTCIFSIIYFLSAPINMVTILLLLSCISLSLAGFYGGEAAFISEQFPTFIRFRAVSIVIAVSNIIFGANAPWVCSLLYNENNTFILSIPIILLTALASFVLKNNKAYSNENKSLL